MDCYSLIKNIKFCYFSVDLKPIVPAILYKDILQAKKSVDVPEAAKSTEETGTTLLRALVNDVTHLGEGVLWQNDECGCPKGIIKGTPLKNVIPPLIKGVDFRKKK